MMPSAIHLQYYCKKMTLTITLFLLLAFQATSVKSQDYLDLFIFTLYANLEDDGSSGIKTPCGLCRATTEDGNCTFSRGVIPAGVCFQDRPDEYRKLEYVPSNNTIGDTSYSDADCTNVVWTGDVLLDECSTSSSFERRRLPDFCIRSTSPLGDYQWPLITALIYENKTECEASTGTEYRPIHWHMDDSNLCWERSIVTGKVSDASRVDTFVHGGQSASCVGGILQVESYTDAACQTPLPMENAGAANDCQLVSKDGTYKKAMNCGAPTIFCKNLAHTENAENIAGTSADSEPDGPDSGSSRRSFTVAAVAMLWLPVCLACMGYDDEKDEGPAIATKTEALTERARMMNVLSPIATAILVVAIAMWAY